MKNYVFNTPIGPLELTIDDNKVYALEPPKRQRSASKVLDHALAIKTKAQLDEFFAGKRETFALPLAQRGTDFQRKVWQRLQRIPSGQTLSYTEVATEVGSPKGGRAVGSACGKNPYLLIVPCHRVLAANNKLGGFSAGLVAKSWLLKHEQA